MHRLPLLNIHRTLLLLANSNTVKIYWCWVGAKVMLRVNLWVDKGLVSKWDHRSSCSYSLQWRWPSRLIPPILVHCQILMYPTVSRLLQSWKSEKLQNKSIVILDCPFKLDLSIHKSWCQSGQGYLHWALKNLNYHLKR